MTINVEDTSRLQFELMSERDAELLFLLDQDPEVMRYINGGTMTTREEVQSTYVPRMKAYTNPENGWGLWKITLKANHAFIGWILVRPVGFFSDDPQFNNLELGWRLLRSAWGQGYATEAARAVMQSLEAKGQCDRFTAHAMEGNLASINVMKKLGMHYVKSGLLVDPLGDVQCVYYEKELGKRHSA